MPADNQAILVALDVGVYNVKKATCGEICFTCDGWVSASISPSPLFVETDQTVQMDFEDQWDTGEAYDLTGEAQWNTGGPTSVNSTGLVTGVYGDNSVSVGASDSSEPVYNQYCGVTDIDECPVAYGVGANASGTVGDATPSISGISPGEIDSGATTQLILTGTGFGTNQPTLNFSPTSGIAYALTSYVDTEIIAKVTVAAGTPTETLDVSVTSNGYSQYGSGFYSAGGSESARSSSASTLVRAAVPNVTLSMKFTGSKSASDGLNFEANGASVYCSEALGLDNCPQAWDWNVEGAAVVSDNDSDWTLSQTVTSGRLAGYYKNASGSLVSFAKTNSSSDDTPGTCCIQQTSGETTIFWIDSPGHTSVYPVGNTTYPIDSMTEVLNFTDTLCSTTYPNDCQSLAWYLKLVVDPGGKLDTSNSSAALGSASINF